MMFTFKIYTDWNLFDWIPHCGKPYESTYSVWWLWFYAEIDTGKDNHSDKAIRTKVF